jgi:dephospho-CoA kinase
MFIVGLTGGIGSGKTAASDIFKSLGVNIVDADIVAREVVKPDQPALKKIIKHFGSDILLTDGSLDRAKLRTLIFSNPSDKAWLEQLLHPIIRDAIQHQLHSSNAAYSILVSPLLFETDQVKLVNRTLLIDVPVDIQLKRASQRDSNSLEQIQKIIDSQLPRDVKLSKADDVICNDKDLAELELKIKEQHLFYLDCIHDQNSRS